MKKFLCDALIVILVILLIIYLIPVSIIVAVGFCAVMMFLGLIQFLFGGR